MTSHLSLIILLSLTHFTKSTQCPTSFIGRCGENWNDANTKCGQCCNYPDDCTQNANENCYAYVNQDPCNFPQSTSLTSSSADTASNSDPPTQETTSVCSTNNWSIRCGLNWVDANTKCGQCCLNNGDCTITGEWCFADLNTLICPATTSTPTTTTASTTRYPTITTQSPMHTSTTNNELNYWNEYTLPTVSGCGTGKRVSLTFDDGPAEQNGETLEIINKLNAYGIKATFYVSPGAWGEDSVELAERCDLIAQLAAAGNEIQSHSWSHPDFTTLSNNEIIYELNKVADFIVDCSGEYPTMFRPPYGSLNKQQAEFIVSEGYIIGLWNLDSKDWLTPNSKVIINNINLNVFNGNSINILMHDRSIYTVINDIIEIFQTNQYEFITQKECFAQCDTINEIGICWDTNGQNLYLATEWMD